MTDELEFDTVFIIGTGAEQGAWAPISRAILSADSTARIAEGDPEQANFWMAKLIALRRATHAVESSGVHGVGGYVGGVHQRFRQEICRELDDAVANGSLTLRPSIREVFRDPAWGTRKLILTTNWDRLLDHEFSSEVVHIHGSTVDWQTLYLPSDYAYDPAHTERTQQSMYVAQDQAIRSLWGAERVCIFGLSLDPLDAELALIVATGINDQPHLRDICICNLKSEEQRLRTRLRLLARRNVDGLVRFQAV
jgi:hypothetical protein